MFIDPESNVSTPVVVVSRSWVTVPLIVPRPAAQVLWLTPSCPRLALDVQIVELSAHMVISPLYVPVAPDPPDGGEATTISPAVVFNVPTPVVALDPVEAYPVVTNPAEVPSWIINGFVPVVLMLLNIKVILRTFAGIPVNVMDVPEVVFCAVAAVIPPAAAQVSEVPFHCRKVLVTVGAAINEVVPDPVLYRIRFAAPPEMLVAFVAELAKVAFVAELANVAFVAELAKVAFVAEPTDKLDWLTHAGSDPVDWSI